ncbi:MAG TPA: GNAT family N-acetyltransferase [Solirubrobacteraceae bacterium]|nr:GNAT family N-acetyltransferase [Solirubrobacteraceae bacterium]
MTEQLGLAGLPDQVRAPLLELQFTARRRDRDARFPDADRQLILLDGGPVGELVLGRPPGSILVVDIALIPAARRQGVGTTVLAGVAATADAAGARVEATARCANTASRRLFATAGFAEVGDDGVNVSLERPAGADAPDSGQDPMLATRAGIPAPRDSG